MGASLLALVVATFCVAYGRTSLLAWTTPITYRGDALFLTAYLRAARDGHVWPGRASSCRAQRAGSRPTGTTTPARWRIVFLGAASSHG